MKTPPVVALDIAFSRCAFRQNHLVGFEFEMEILNLVDRACLDDRQCIDEVLGRNQDTVEKQRVPRRQPQIAHRDLGRQRTRAHDDRQNPGVAGDEPPGIAAPADPLDRLCLTRERHHHVTDSKVLNCDPAAFRQDQRPTTVARWVLVVVVMIVIMTVFVIMIVIVTAFVIMIMVMSATTPIISGAALITVLAPLLVGGRCHRMTSEISCLPQGIS